jgi:deoxyribose-phosphate aldolase
VYEGFMVSTELSNGAPYISPQHLAQYIEHTLLRPDASEDSIDRLCDEALEFSFKGVCVELRWIPKVVRRLKDSKVLPVTVISFPAGEDSTEEKCRQALRAVELGAKEIDMVLNRRLLKEKSYRELFLDIAEVVQAAGSVPVKVILETSELNHDEKIIACVLAKAAEAAFVKTSTGFTSAGATESDVKLMRSVVGEDMGVKASGGVRSYDDAIRLIHSGATRLGTSGGVALVKGSPVGEIY